MRAEFTPEKSGTTMPLGDRNQDAIPVGKAVAMYVRSGTDADPRVIPAANYSLAPDGHSIEMPGGFEAGMLYEFVYQGKDPVVAGAGLAAVRDFISYLKYGGEAAGWSGARPSVNLAIGFGISQSGRWLREFLYDGFNADESGRKVFDGVWADVAGAGRGSFNFRYAQPSRDGWPYLNVFYPTDLFPFTDTDETDPVTGKTGGLLDRARAARVLPKTFFTNDSSEYWGRAASLIHITADGKHDAPISPDTRIYFMAGVQHFPRNLPLAKQGTQYDINVVDHRPVQRALLAALEAWIKDGVAPPASVYPHLADGQLTNLAGLKFPALEGVTHAAASARGAAARFRAGVRIARRHSAGAAEGYRRVPCAGAAGGRRWHRSRRRALAGGFGSAGDADRLEPAIARSAGRRIRSRSFTDRLSRWRRPRNSARRRMIRGFPSRSAMPAAKTI